MAYKVGGRRADGWVPVMTSTRLLVARESLNTIRAFEVACSLRYSEKPEGWRGILAQFCQAFEERIGATLSPKRAKSVLERLEEIGAVTIFRNDFGRMVGLRVECGKVRCVSEQVQTGPDDVGADDHKVQDVPPEGYTAYLNPGTACTPPREQRELKNPNPVQEDPASNRAPAPARDDTKAPGRPVKRRTGRGGRPPIGGYKPPPDEAELRQRAQQQAALLAKGDDHA